MSEEQRTLPPGVRQEDVDCMISALAAFRGAEWWYAIENEGGERACLAPVVMQNMKLKLESGTLEPSMLQFQNLLKSAIFYHGEMARLRAARAALTSAEGSEG